MIKIEKSQLDFHAFKFVLRARSDDPAKPILTCLFSDGKNAVCTDSRRLHIIKLDREVPQGLYDVITSTTKEIVLHESAVEGQFPDYGSVLGGILKEKIALQPLREWSKYVHGAHTLFGIMSKGVCVNPEYVEHACKDCGDLKIVVSGSPTSPIKIVNDFGIAVIMPITTGATE